MSSTAAHTYRWSREGFLRAHEAGAFDSRVELINGEVWPVVIGDSHGEALARLMALLATTADHGIVTASTLPAGDSLPDPDCWVRRPGAERTGQLGGRLSAWDSADVLLVVEVSDDSLVQDLNVKDKLYGSVGYPTYWVISTDVVYEHTEPTADGYRVRVEYRAGQMIPLRYADIEVPVDAVLTDGAP